MRQPLHAVVIGALLGGIVAPVLNAVMVNERYRITPAVAAVVEKPSPTLAPKLLYSESEKGNVFNGGANVPDKDKLATMIGGGGEESNQLYSAVFPDDATKGIEVTDNVNNITVGFEPKNIDLLDGREAGGRVVYPLRDAAGAMIFTPKANGVKEDVVLTEPGKSDTAEFSYNLKIPDTVEPRLERDGGVGFYTGTPELFGDITYGTDKDRSTVEQARRNAEKTYLMFKIPAPRVRENKGQGSVKARFSLSGKTLTVRATGLLTGGYPLSIDPTFLLSSTNEFVLGSVDDNIDLSVDGQVARQALVGGSTPGWNPNDAPNIPSNPGGQFATALVAYNGYLYMIGGGSDNSNTTTTSKVLYISLDPTTGELGTGTPSTWTLTSSLQVPRQGLVAFGFNGYMYAVGGENDSGTPYSSVEYAHINTDGSVGSWSYTASLNSPRSYLAGTIYQGVAYVMGGTSAAINANALDTTEHARINGNGTISSWDQSTSAATGDLTSVRSKFRAGAYNGFVYITGGRTSATTVTNAVEYAPIKSDGSLGNWASTSAFPTARRDHGMAINNGYIYVFGGCSGAAQSCSGFISDTQYAVINADGTVGQWQETVPYNTGGFNSRMPGGSTAFSNHLYFVGGCSTEQSNNNCGTRLVGTFITDIDGVGRFDRGVSTDAAAPYSGEATSARMGGKAVALNGYMYYVSGCSSGGCGTYDATVGYAPINADGTIGDFTATTSLPAGSGNTAGRLGHSLVAYNDKLYVLGGTERTPGTSSFPSVQSVTESSFASNTTTHNVDMPATVAPGDLLLCLFSDDGGDSVTTPSGWTRVVTTANGSNVRGSVFAKAADGTEDGDTVNFRTSGSEQASAQVYRILAADWYGDAASGVDASGASAGTTSAPNPPSLSPSWGSDQTLWLSYAAGSSYNGVNSYPSGFGSGVHTIGGSGTGGSSVSSAQLTLATGTENPGAFSMSNSTSGVELTVAIRPPDPATDTYMQTVLTATQNSDGTLGSWSDQSSLGGHDLPAARAFHTSATWHNYVYVIGGRDSSNTYGTVYYAQIAADGTIGAWNTASNGITARWGHSGGIWGNWMYVVSGQTDTAGTYIGTSAGAGAVQKLTINPANGDISAVDGYASNTARRLAGGFVSKGFLYTFGGNLSSSTNASSDISWAPLDPTSGAPGTLVTSNIGNRGDLTDGLASARSQSAAVVSGGYIYALGGCTSATSANSFRGCSGFVSVSETTEMYLPNNGGTGQTNDFAAVTAMSSARADHASVAYNGVLYNIGGCTGYSSGVCSAGSSEVKSTAINPDGTLGGSWTTQTSLPGERSMLQAAAYNGYMYVLGGKSNGSNATRTVWYAPISSTGTLGAWTDNSSNYLPSGAERVGFGAAVSGGYLYVAGGDNGSGTKKNDVYFAHLDGTTGAPGGWAATTAFSTARWNHSLVAYNGRLYVIGGSSGAVTLRGIQYATIDSATGEVGTWAHTTDVSRGMVARQVAAANGFMYFFGNEGDGTQVKYVSINADGTLGKMQTSIPVMSNAHAHGSVAFTDGVFYVTGGCSLSGGSCSTVSAASEKAGQQAVSRRGHYSKLFDTAINTAPSQVVLNGALSGGGSAVEFKFFTASESNPELGVAQVIRPVIFGNYYGVQALDSSGNNVGVASNYFLALNLDDSRSGTFPDVPSTSAGSGQTAVTDITLYYHANPGRRLRHGASFTDTDCNPTPTDGCLLDTAP